MVALLDPYATQSSRELLVLGVEQLSLERVTLLRISVTLIAPPLERHGELLDARAVDLEHVEPHTVVRHVVSDLRLAAEQAENETGERVVILDG